MKKSATHSSSNEALQWFASILAIALTVVITILGVLAARSRLDARTFTMHQAQTASFRPGVSATLTADGTTIERDFPTLDLELAPGQTLDDRLPGGAIEAEFIVRFMAGRVHTARVGALLQGGSVIILRNGEVMHSNFVGAHEAVVLTTIPLSFSRAPQELTYIFRTDGRQPARLQAMWQPIDADAPEPLPMGTH
jgi:hypothetical protein